MSTVQGGQGNIVTNGLVLNLDAANPRSYLPPYNGTTWFDLSGNNYSGSLANGPTYNSANGGSIVFDGVDDYMVRDTLPNFNVNNISIWINPSTLINSSTTFKSIIQLRYQAAAGNFAWGISLGAATVLLTNEYITISNVLDNSRTAVADGGSLLANTWYSLVFNFESDQYRIYVNNVLKTTINSGNVPLLTNPNKLYISTFDGDGLGLRGFFNGSIGKVQIYNRTLSISEINQNFQATRARFGI